MKKLLVALWHVALLPMHQYYPQYVIAEEYVAENPEVKVCSTLSFKNLPDHVFNQTALLKNFRDDFQDAPQVCNLTEVVKSFDQQELVHFFSLAKNPDKNIEASHSPHELVAIANVADCLGNTVVESLCTERLIKNLNAQDIFDYFSNAGVLSTAQKNVISSLQHAYTRTFKDSLQNLITKNSIAFTANSCAHPVNNTLFFATRADVCCLDLSAEKTKTQWPLSAVQLAQIQKEPFENVVMLSCTNGDLVRLSFDTASCQRIPTAVSSIQHLMVNNGKTFFTNQQSHDVGMYDMQTQAFATDIKGHKMPIIALQKIADGVVTIAVDKAILWNESMQKQLNAKILHQITDINAWAIAGKKLVVVDTKKQNAVFIDWSKDSMVVFTQPMLANASSCALDDSHIFTGHDNAVRCWDAKTFSLYKSYGADCGRVLRIVPQDHMLYVVGSWGVGLVFDRHRTEQQMRFRVSVEQGDFYIDGSYMVGLDVFRRGKIFPIHLEQAMRKTDAGLLWAGLVLHHTQHKKPYTFSLAPQGLQKIYAAVAANIKKAWKRTGIVHQDDIA